MKRVSTRTVLVSALLTVVAACNFSSTDLPDARATLIDAPVGTGIDALRAVIDAASTIDGANSMGDAPTSTTDDAAVSVMDDAALSIDARVRGTDAAVTNIDAVTAVADAGASHSPDASTAAVDASQIADASPPAIDASQVDGARGTPDASPPDASSPDASPPDSSPPDASPPDAALPPILTYASGTTVFTVGSPNTTVSPSIYNLEGSSVISCGIKSGTTALPNGLHVDNTLCTILGTPTSPIGAITYNVELVTTSGTVDATVTLSVHIAVAIQIGGAGSATNVTTTVFDGDGNVIVAGTYTAALTVGLSLPITGTEDLFVAKFTDTGTLVWQKHFGSAGKAASAIEAVADSSNNVTVLTLFTGSVDAGDGNSVATIGTNAMFLARYAPDGTYVWSRFFNGASASLGMGTLNVDAAGDVAVVVDWADGTVNFGGGAISEGSGWGDAMIAKYSGATGSCVWGKNINTNGLAEVGSQGAGNGAGLGPTLAFDSHNNFVIEFYQNVGTWNYGDINGVANSGEVTNTSAFDCYAVVLVKFGSATGATQWTRLLKSAGTTNCGMWNGPLAVDSSDNVISAFYFTGPTVIGAASNVTSETANDSGVAEYDSNGAFRWFVDLGSSSNFAVNAITVEADDQVLLASYLSGTATLSGQTLTSVGAIGAVNLRYASDGTYISSNAYGGSGTEEELAIASNGVSTIAGMTFSSSGLSVSSSSSTFTPVGSNDTLIFSNP